jgi:hypothetical protein
MSHLQKFPELVLPDGKIISKGDIIKVYGEYGLKFRFDSFVKHPNGAEWVDCFEMFRGRAGAYRSFRSDRIKRIPKKRVKK